MSSFLTDKWESVLVFRVCDADYSKLLIEDVLPVVSKFPYSFPNSKGDWKCPVSLLGYVFGIAMLKMYRRKLIAGEFVDKSGGSLPDMKQFIEGLSSDYKEIFPRQIDIVVGTCLDIAFSDPDRFKRLCDSIDLLTDDDLHYMALEAIRSNLETDFFNDPISAKKTIKTEVQA